MLWLDSDTVYGPELHHRLSLTGKHLGASVAWIMKNSSALSINGLAYSLLACYVANMPGEGLLLGSSLPNPDMMRNGFSDALQDALECMGDTDSCTITAFFFVMKHHILDAMLQYFCFNVGMTSSAIAPSRDWRRALIASHLRIRSKRPTCTRS